MVRSRVATNIQLGLVRQAVIEQNVVDIIPARTIRPRAVNQNNIANATRSPWRTESNETSLTPERPIRPIAKPRALGRETGSTFCSRGPDRQLANRPSEGDS